MEKLYQFFPSLIIIACIACGVMIHLKLMERFFGDKLKDLEWLRKNRWKVYVFFGFPSAIVRSPAVEELVFRAPLIIMFDEVTSSAWIGIAISAVVFGLIHWYGRKVFLFDLYASRDKGEHESNDLSAEVDRLAKKNPKEQTIRKVIQITATMIMGALAGYFGIKYQSIWLAVIIHSVWNFLATALLPVVLLVLVLVVTGIYNIFEGFRSERKMRSRLKRKW